MGAVLNPVGGIAMAGGDTLPAGSLSNFGLDLSGHHPVSFPYHAALPNAELVASPPPDLVYGGTDEVHCITCHDPHNDTYGKFLVKDNRYSALCTTCHQMTGWSGSAHATSTASVVGDPAAAAEDLADLHAAERMGMRGLPHAALRADRRRAAELHRRAPTVLVHQRRVPLGAAGSAPRRGGGRTRRGRGAMVDIGAQIAQDLRAPRAAGRRWRCVRTAAETRARREPAVSAARIATIRTRTDGREAEAPYVSGFLAGVSGVDRNGAGSSSAVTYEYEVCFKCHGDNTPDLRLRAARRRDTNTRLAFDTVNPSYHPVIGLGRNLNIPSIPSSFAADAEPVAPDLLHDLPRRRRGRLARAARLVVPPILKERYETADNTPESYDNYALCYRCHDRTSILRDVSFRKKTVRDDAVRAAATAGTSRGRPVLRLPRPARRRATAARRRTGVHTHLINFDTRVVLPNRARHSRSSATPGRSRGAARWCATAWRTTTRPTPEPRKAAPGAPAALRRAAASSSRQVHRRAR